MSYLKITKTNNNTVWANLTNKENTYNIPVKISGNGLAHFYQNSNKEKMVKLFPDLIYVMKNNNVVSSMKDIKVSSMFGKTVIEGVSTVDWHSTIMVDVCDIKEMWCDSYDNKCDVWNIEI